MFSLKYALNPSVFGVFRISWMVYSAFITTFQFLSDSLPSRIGPTTAASRVWQAPAKRASLSLGGSGRIPCGVHSSSTSLRS